MTWTRTVWAMFPAVLIYAIAVEAAPMQAESRITAVTVFEDRALVTRSASLDLHEETTEVRIGPLPAQVEPGSVTAKGAGKAHVTLYGASVRSIHLEQAQEPKVQDLEKQLREVQSEQQRLRNLKQVLANEREYLDSIKAASGEQIGKDIITKTPSAQDAAALLTFLDEGYLKTFEREQQADRELEELARRFEKIQREIAELSQGRRRQETYIIVELGVAKPGRFDLEVAYRLPGATWEPLYEARAASGGESVELVSYGLIRQRTGEDWNDARVTLSTAKPAVGGTLPELDPLFLRPMPEIVAQRAMRMKAAAAPAMEMHSQAFFADAVGSAYGMAEPPVEADMAEAVIGAQGPSVTYTLPKPESVPSDWQPRKAPIGGREFKAEFAYGISPRLAERAYLRARARNNTEQLFLAGPVSVFLDGAFIATANLEQVAPGEEFDLYLGTDERVKVERKTLKERVEVSLFPGLRGKTKTIEYTYLTLLENFSGKEIAVTAIDLVPVSEREEIIVDEIRVEPSEIEKDPERPGVFRWTLKLAPGEKKELRVSYRVRHPADMAVQGL